MGKYSNLKAEINEKITTNGRMEITGAKLNGVLNDVADAAVTAEDAHRSSGDGIVQLYEGNDPVYPRTKAEAVFFDNDTSKTLDQQFSQLGQEMIMGWILDESFTLTSATRDSDGNISSAIVAWPDGVSGTLAITRNDDGLAMSVAAGYSTDTYTYTITRDSEGNVTSTSLVKQ